MKDWLYYLGALVFFAAGAMIVFTVIVSDLSCIWKILLPFGFAVFFLQFLSALIGSRK